MQATDEPTNIQQYRPMKTPEEIAAIVHMPVHTVRHMLRTNVIPGRKLGQQWRSDADQFDRWYQEYMRVEEPASA